MGDRLATTAPTRGRWKPAWAVLAALAGVQLVGTAIGLLWSLVRLELLAIPLGLLWMLFWWWIAAGALRRARPAEDTPTDRSP